MRAGVPVLAALWALAACNGRGGGPVGTGFPGPCDEANERLGFTACVHGLSDEGTWTTVAKVATAVDQVRLTKHLVPMADTDDALPPLLANSNAFALHSEFLAETFPETFGGLDQEGYRELVLGADRPYASGNLVELADPDGDGQRRFGFVIWDYHNQPDETVTLAQAIQVWQALAPMVAPLTEAELLFLPYTDNQVAAAADWQAPFPVQGFDDSVIYEAYTPAVGFGTLRLVDVAELEALEAEGALGWQDLVVFDAAPFDLERVVSGVVTGSRQTGLSHLNVRSAARGTPNCFRASAQEVLAPYEGLLVRLECGEDALSVRSATLAEAEAFWAELRPEAVDIVVPDLDSTVILPLLDLPPATAAEREANVATYGSKGAWLGLLYQRISAQQQLEGLVVPMSAYAAFLEQPWQGAPGGEASFAVALETWFADEDFLADAALRR